LIGLDESLAALEEAFYDLSDEQIWAYPIQGRHNIATIVAHCLQNVDGHVDWILSAHLSGKTSGGTCVFEHEERFELYGLPEYKLPKPGDIFPRAEEMLETLENVVTRAMELVSKVEEGEFLEPAPDYWPHLGDPCFRAIYHTMAHVRQIWLLRGALGVADGRSWPRQHWA